jgi:hypothetical protein
MHICLPTNMANDNLHILFFGHDIELRIVSLIMKGRQFTENVSFIDCGSTDETKTLAQEIQCPVLHYSGEIIVQHIAEFISKEVSWNGKILLINVTKHWKISDLLLDVNRANEDWDVYYAFHTDDNATDEEDSSSILSRTIPRILVASKSGCQQLSSLNPLATATELDSKLKVRVIHTGQRPVIMERESLATASRFAQLFYWMLESKHPLFLFGIPGIILFVLGYRLSGNLTHIFTELNTTSIGVTLATIAMTLVGLFAMMIAIILYILGKQVKRIQAQYNWPRNS